MLLGGVWVEDQRIRELVRIVDKSLGRKLESALLFRAAVVGLSQSERAAVMSALDDAPAELKEVRDLLLADENWRVNKRLD